MKKTMILLAIVLLSMGLQAQVIEDYIETLGFYQTTIDIPYTIEVHRTYNVTQTESWQYSHATSIIPLQFSGIIFKLESSDTLYFIWDSSSSRAEFVILAMANNIPIVINPSQEFYIEAVHSGTTQILDQSSTIFYSFQDSVQYEFSDDAGGVANSLNQKLGPLSEFVYFTESSRLNRIDLHLFPRFLFPQAIHYPGSRLSSFMERNRRYDITIELRIDKAGLELAILNDIRRRFNVNVGDNIGITPSVILSR